MARALPSRVAGIDFSGAADAGRKIWVAEGRVIRGKLHVEACDAAADRFQCAPGPQSSCAALVAFLCDLGPIIVGCDFPFSLPAAMIQERDWTAFARAFAERFPTAQVLHEETHRRWGELRRACDKAARTPFAPVNWRLYRQTYHGLRDVLAPLVAQGKACVVPVQSPRVGVPWLLECCPASALKVLGLYAPYKGTAAQHARQRRAIVRGLLAHGIAPFNPRVRRIIESQPGGDALDSVVAAWIAYRVTAGHEPLQPRMLSWPVIEGYVYSGFPLQH
jgi:hypothetical protein